MRSMKVGAGASVVVASVLLLSQACVGEDPVIGSAMPLPEAGTGAAADTTPPRDTADSAPPAEPECTLDTDCTSKLPMTTPANCALATCDLATKKCLFKSKDADGDGHAAKTCAGGTVTIATGDDCDDADPSTYPGAWDGPASELDSGPDARADRCDQRDNDCNGSPDDGRMKVDGGDKTCKCDPSAPLPCYEYENGTPIDATTLDGDNKPKGTCKKGQRSCPNGVPGACIGAVGPAAEQCDTLDHDCDGISGNAGDAVTGAPTWFKDADNDNAGDQNVTPKQQCTAPGAEWKQSISNTDCKDDDAAMKPGLAEACDGKDNNCNGVVDDGYSIGTTCTSGTAGICKRNGTLQCATTSTASCSPAAGTPVNNGSLTASADPAIYTAGDTANYIAAWDYNCNGTVEAEPTGVNFYNFASPAAASSLCSGNNQAACAAMGSTQATCLPVVYPCGLPCGTTCTKAQACGKTVKLVPCSWDFINDGSPSCDTYGTASNQQMYCK